MAKGLIKEQVPGIPIFIEENDNFFGLMDYAILSIQLNFTNIHMEGIELLSKIQKEFVWFKKSKKATNNTFVVFENLDAVC